MFPSTLQTYYQTQFQKFRNFFPGNDSLTYQEEKDDPRLELSLYQKQFKIHHESLKNEYRPIIHPLISYVALNRFINSPPENNRYFCRKFCV